LVDTSDVEVMTNADRGEIARIENEIQRLQNEYDNDEEGRADLLDEISDLEDELDDLTKKIDVYNIIPTGSFYYTTEFEVIDSPDLEGRTYAVGTDSEMQRSCEESLEGLIDDVGYEGFNASFVRNHLDERAIISYAEDLFDQDIRDNPEAYIDEEERMLSDRQEETIARLERNMLQIESMISRLEDEMDGENEEQDEETQEKIDELNEKLEELKDEITEIQDDPEGDYPEDAIEEAIRVRVKDVEYDPEEFLKEFGLDLDDYVDKDSLIESIIDEDGYGHTLNSYDGNADDVRVQDELYYVMRIN
jgi:predicted  nucleic acid-binding Zn-ribbon protein